MECPLSIKPTWQFQLAFMRAVFLCVVFIVLRCLGYVCVWVCPSAVQGRGERERVKEKGLRERIEREEKEKERERERKSITYTHRKLRGYSCCSVCFQLCIHVLYFQVWRIYSRELF